jgi:hypothetical protein
VADEVLVFTPSVVLATLSVALPVVLLTLPVVHVVAEGCADMRVPVMVVGISSLEVDESLQGQSAIFCPVGDLLNFVMLDLSV